jgi:F-type H+-transporting ATPase subunit epsilon
MSMKLTIVLPDRIMAEKEVQAVTAQTQHESVELLQRHMDIVLTLSCGLLEYCDEGGMRWYVAHDDGVLVKDGREVLVSIGRAVQDPDRSRVTEALQEYLTAVDARRAFSPNHCRGTAGR